MMAARRRKTIVTIGGGSGSFVLLSVLRRYARMGAAFVDVRGLDRSRSKPRYILADVLEAGPFVRHNSRGKLARVILSLLR